MKARFLGLILAVAFSLAFASLILGAGTLSGRFVKVIDGDSLVIEHEGMYVQIRLYGIDAPEWNQPFGKESKAFVKDLVLDKPVTFGIHSQDRFQRNIAEVFLPDGRNLGHELLKAGLARWFKKYAPDDEELKRLEERAKVEKAEMWSIAR